MSDKPLTPLRNDIVRNLRRRLASGEFQPDVFLPSEKELAEQLVVSRWTIRNVLDYLIRQGDLVRSPSGRLLIARSEATPSAQSRPGSVFLWTHRSMDWIFTDFLKGFLDSIDPFKFKPSIRTGSVSRSYMDCASSEEAAFLEEALGTSDCRAVVVWRAPGQSPTRLYREISRRKIPLVFVETSPPLGLFAHYIGHSRRAAVTGVMQHLFDLGHRKIVGISHDCGYSGDQYEMIEGFHIAAKELGIQSTCSVVEAFPSDPGRIVRALSASPTALLNLSQTDSKWIINLCRNCNLRVPTDVSVATCYASVSYNNDKASTISGAGVDYVAIGRRAAYHTVWLSETDDVTNYESIYMNCNWVNGYTVSPANQPTDSPK